MDDNESITAVAAGRRLQIGAEPGPAGVSFRVWAPRCRGVDVVLEDAVQQDCVLPLTREPGGYFSGLAAGLAAGSRYRFALDGAEPIPDPASRFQPEGPHGPSQVVDPGAFSWRCGAWMGPGRGPHFIYEMHVGTFTPEGTWARAAAQISELADLGITVIEVLPVADFTGTFGWGYDGVNLFAPTRLYGAPDDFRRFVDEAHRLGIGVVLDVVYNHLGPDGNYLKRFSDTYFSGRYTTEWGDALNFDGEGSEPVREFVLCNARAWIEEFRLDGLRVDATQSIFDSSADHILAALAREVRKAANGRSTLLIAENEPQEVKIVRPLGEGGYGFDMLWNDDFHHSAIVALTGRREAYYHDHLGWPQEFVSAAKYGYLFQGQYYSWQGKRRGTPTRGLPPETFVNYIQNHDQIANSGRGQRIHDVTSAGRYRAMTALLILSPGTPMLFQGQEFAASSPFFYFADHKGELARAVREGRAEFLRQFPSIASEEMQACLTNPADPSAFRRSKLDPAERRRHGEDYRLHKDLIAVRRSDPVIAHSERGTVDGAVVGRDAFVLRFFDAQNRDRLLVVNLGLELHMDAAPEPLLAPPEGRLWTVLWSSESPAYGGTGTPPHEDDAPWRLPSEAAILLSAELAQEETG